MGVPQENRKTKTFIKEREGKREGKREKEGKERTSEESEDC